MTDNEEVIRRLIRSRVIDVSRGTDSIENLMADVMEMIAAGSPYAQIMAKECLKIWYTEQN